MFRPHSLRNLWYNLNAGHFGSEQRSRIGVWYSRSRVPTGVDVFRPVFQNDMIFRLILHNTYTDWIPTIVNRSRWARIEQWSDITLDIVVIKLIACPSMVWPWPQVGLNEQIGQYLLRQPCCHCLSSQYPVVIDYCQLSVDGAALYCLSGQPICNLVTLNSHVSWSPHKFYIIIELLKVPSVCSHKPKDRPPSQL
jgi:hypothetical protein